MTWIQTYTGRQFWPLDPRPEDIDIRDIAHSLSLQCRFNGHSILFYGVGEHSVRVSRIVPAADRLWGLLHDAAEAYLTDVAKPLKPHLFGYRAFEESLLHAVAYRFGLPWPIPESVKRADAVLLATEARDVMGPRPAPWCEMPEPLELIIHPVSPEFAETLFLSAATELGVEP